MDAEVPDEREVLEERYDLTHKVIWISSLYKCFAPTFAKLADGSANNFPGVLKDQALILISSRWLLLEKATLRAMRQDDLLEFPLSEAIGSSLQHANQILEFLDEAVDKVLIQELARSSGETVSIMWDVAFPALCAFQALIQQHTSSRCLQESVADQEPSRHALCQSDFARCIKPPLNPGLRSKALGSFVQLSKFLNSSFPEPVDDFFDHVATLTILPDDKRVLNKAEAVAPLLTSLFEVLSKSARTGRDGQRAQLNLSGLQSAMNSELEIMLLLCDKSNQRMWFSASCRLADPRESAAESSIPVNTLYNKLEGPVPDAELRIDCKTQQVFWFKPLIPASRYRTDTAGSAGLVTPLAISQRVPLELDLEGPCAHENPLYRRLIQVHLVEALLYLYQGPWLQDHIKIDHIFARPKTEKPNRFEHVFLRCDLDSISLDEVTQKGDPRLLLRIAWVLLQLELGRRLIPESEDDHFYRTEIQSLMRDGSRSSTEIHRLVRRAIYACLNYDQCVRQLEDQITESAQVCRFVILKLIVQNVWFALREHCKRQFEDLDEAMQFYLSKPPCEKCRFEKIKRPRSSLEDDEDHKGGAKGGLVLDGVPLSLRDSTSVTLRSDHSDRQDGYQAKAKKAKRTGSIPVSGYRPYQSDIRVTLVEGLPEAKDVDSRTQRPYSKENSRG